MCNVFYNKFYRTSTDLTKPKTRTVSTETLKGINELFKRTEEEKRRLELESGLYKRLRHSAREESILLSSKSNNEALAKMNWLDKQVKRKMFKFINCSSIHKKIISRLQIKWKEKN